METVAAYRLKELNHFQAIEQLATWRRTYGYDREDSWMHGTRPLAPEEFTAVCEITERVEGSDLNVC